MLATRWLSGFLSKLLAELPQGLRGNHGRPAQHGSSREYGDTRLCTTQPTLPGGAEPDPGEDQGVGRVLPIAGEPAVLKRRRRVPRSAVFIEWKDLHKAAQRVTSDPLASFCSNSWKNCGNCSQRNVVWGVDLCLDLVPLVPSAGF